jgi:VWFA-related protein
MPRVGSILGPAILVVALHLHAQTPTPQSRFRGGTDLVQVDVSVLDKNRRPVRGLTAADFTVLEDGQSRAIQAFTEVYLPDRVRRSAPSWIRDVPRDVASNQASEDDGRLVIIVLDRTIPVGVATITARRTAAAVVSALGPSDLAAVVSTSGGATHNLTSDRSRLLRTINESELSTGMSVDAKEIEEQLWELSGLPYPSPLSDGRCLCKVCVLDTITRVADAVQATPRRRKVMFFIGSDLTLQSTNTVERAAADVGCEIRERFLLFDWLPSGGARRDRQIPRRYRQGQPCRARCACAEWLHGLVSFGGDSIRHGSERVDGRYESVIEWASPKEPRAA